MRRAAGDAIIHQRMQRVGRERGGVVRLELGERAHEVGRRRMGRGERIASNSWRRCDEARERLERT